MNVEEEDVQSVYYICTGREIERIKKMTKGRKEDYIEQVREVSKVERRP